MKRNNKNALNDRRSLAFKRARSRVHKRCIKECELLIAWHEYLHRHSYMPMGEKQQLLTNTPEE